MLVTVLTAAALFRYCSWRQTGGCDPNNPREPEFDMLCSDVVAGGQSGYCECGDGSIVSRVGCGHETFRCSEMCPDESSDEKRPSPVDRRGLLKQVCPQERAVSFNPNALWSDSTSARKPILRN